MVQTEMGYQSLEKGTSLLCLDRPQKVTIFLVLTPQPLLVYPF